MKLEPINALDATASIRPFEFSDSPIFFFSLYFLPLKKIFLQKIMYIYIYSHTNFEIQFYFILSYLAAAIKYKQMIKRLVWF